MENEPIPQDQQSIEVEAVKAPVETEIVEASTEQKENSSSPTNDETTTTSAEGHSNVEDESSNNTQSNVDGEINEEKESNEATKEVQPTQEEITAAAFQAVYEKALETKEQGTAFYKAQQFTSAKVKYAEAMASIQVNPIVFFFCY